MDKMQKTLPLLHFLLQYLQQILHPIKKTGTPGQFGPHFLLYAHHHMEDGADDDLLPGIKIIVSRPLSDPRFLGNIRHLKSAHIHTLENQFHHALIELQNLCRYLFFRFKSRYLSHCFSLPRLCETLCFCLPTLFGAFSIFLSPFRDFPARPDCLFSRIKIS